MDPPTHHLGDDYFGYIAETADALRLLQLAVRGFVNVRHERLSTTERDHIASGNVFILEEGTEITRWTDGKHWSPSRSLGNFMIYREVSSSSAKRRRPMQRQNRPTLASPSYTHLPERLRTGMPPNPELSYYGSLIDTYEFVPNGLVKKTFMGQYHNRRFRIISYYRAEDLSAHTLVPPLDHPDLIQYPYVETIDPYVRVPRAHNDNFMGGRMETTDMQWSDVDYDDHHY